MDSNLNRTCGETCDMQGLRPPGFEYMPMTGPLRHRHGWARRDVLVPRSSSSSDRLNRSLIQIRLPFWLTEDVYHDFSPLGDRSMPAKVIRTQGKSMFVKEVLNDNPFANAEAVNDAWQAAGMSGSISASLVNNVRSRLGLAGNLRGNRRTTTKTTGKRRGRPPMQIHADANQMTMVKTRGRKADLMQLEVDIDHLLMKVVEIGTLLEVENALRKVRRQLYAGLAAVS